MSTPKIRPSDYPFAGTPTEAWRAALLSYKPDHTFT